MLQLGKIMKIKQLNIFTLITFLLMVSFLPKSHATETSIASVNEAIVNSLEQTNDKFIAGEHYVVLNKPVATRDKSKVEVVEMFSYGCPHCFEFEPLIKEWVKNKSNNIDFWYFPAVWNQPMELFAKAFYTAHELNILEKIHIPLFTTIVIEQKKLSTENDLANFFTEYGIDNQAFTHAFNSSAVENQAKLAQQHVHSYSPAGVPEIIINGKYRIDRMRAGGLKEMLEVADYLIKKEQELL